jgi:hypothetical protein
MVGLDQPTELQQISQEAAPSSDGPRVSIALKNILVPTDLSDRAKKAVNYAVALAEHFGAKLTLLYVDTTPTWRLTSAVPMRILFCDDIARPTWKPSMSWGGRSEARRNRRNQNKLFLFYKVGLLLREINNHPCL